MAVGDDHVIEEDVVRIRGELERGFEQKLRAKIDGALKKINPELKIKVVADTKGLAADVRTKVAALKSLPTIKVKLEADAVGLTAEVRAKVASYNEKSGPKVKVALQADTKGFVADVKAKVAALAGTKVKVGVDLDAADLRAKVDAAISAAGAGNKVDIDIDVDPATIAAKIQAAVAAVGNPDVAVEVNGRHLRNSLKIALAAGEPYHVKVKASLEGDSGLNELALRNGRAGRSMWDSLAPPRLINFGGRGIQPYNLLIGSLIALTPLLVAVTASAAQASFALTALGTAGIGAGLSVGGLVVAFTPLIEALQLRKSVQAQETTQAANANKELAKQVKQQNDLNKARREAIRNLEDLRQKVIDLANAEKDDALSLEEAQAKRREVYSNYFSTSLQRRRADQDVANARVKLSGTKLNRRQAGQDLALGRSKGVEGSDAVTNAKAATAAITSPAANLAATIAKLAPAAQELYHLIDDNQSTFDKLSRGIQQQVLPGFTETLRQLLKTGKTGKSSFEVAADAAGLLGGKIGDVAADLAKLTRSRWFRKDFSVIVKANAAFMDSLRRATVKLVKPFMTIFRDASPLLTRFGGYIEEIATKFADFIDNADRSGQLQAFLKRAGDEFARWGALARGVFNLLSALFQVSAPAGGSVVDQLTAFFNNSAEWVRKHKKEVQSFFDRFAGLNWGQIKDTLVQLGIVFTAAAGLKMAVKNPLWTLITALAVAHPKEAQEFLAALSSFIIDTATWVSAHKTETELLLGLLAALKVASTLKAIKLSAALSIPSLAVTGAVVAGTFIAEKITGKNGDDLWADAWHNLTDPIFDLDAARARQEKFMTDTRDWIGHFFSTDLPNFLNLGVGQGGWSGFGANIQRWFSMTLPNWLFGGNQGWAGAGPYFMGQLRDIGSFITEGLWQGISDGWVWLSVKMDGAIADFWAWLKKLFGVKSPSTISASIGGYLVEGLYNGFIDKWKSIWTTFSTWIRTNIVDPLTDVFGKAGKAIVAVFTNPFATLQSALAAPVTKAFTWVNSYLIDPLNKLLSAIFLPNIPHISVAAGSTGGQGSAVGNAVGNAVKNVGPVVKKADGGPIGGYSPNSRADNIPALLTAGEYVHPVDSVQHYGPAFMEAVRTKRFPRYADGGYVGDSLVTTQGESLATQIIGGALGKFSVSDLFSSVATATGGGQPDTGSAGGGHVIGDENVAEIAESTARRLGATSKQLIALIEAGIVESGLRNLTVAVDHDSVGFLQQRPSQGWGTVAQLLDPAYATRKFIEVAKAMDTPAIDAGELAARVQRPAKKYRSRYGEQYANAVAVLNARTPYLGGVGAGVGSVVGDLSNFVRYSGKIAPGLGKVNNVSTALYSAIVEAEAAFPNAKVTSSYRPGSITVTGNHSYHGREPSRAADFAPPSMALFNHFAALYGNRAKEIIYSPANERQIWNGRPHLFSGDVRKGHFDHVHLALAGGGPVRSRKYDTGGSLPPGYTVAFNGTGKTETIRTAEQEKQLGGPMRLHPADIAALGRSVAAAASPTVAMDGRKVAEITNAYTYLPAGV